MQKTNRKRTNGYTRLSAAPESNIADPRAFSNEIVFIEKVWLLGPILKIVQTCI